MVAAKCSDEEFVSLWRELGSPAAVAKATGMSYRRALDRRRSLEARGHNLPTTSDGRIRDRVEAIGYTDHDWTVAWDKSDGLSIMVANPLRVGKDHLRDVLEDTLQDIRKAAPKLPKVPKPAKGKDPVCLVINMSDLHFGGWGLDNARQAVEIGLQDAIARSAPYDIERIHFVMGSDCLHVDNVNRSTSKGTPLETDGSTWAEAFTAAKDAYIHCISVLRQIAPVTAIHVGGNHDELSSWCLAQVVEAYFHNTPDVTFDVTDHPRKYHSFGATFLAYTHGDRVKETELPMVVAHEAPELWGQTRHRYILMGHFHTTKAVKYLAIQERPGVILQWLRSPKLSDQWHLAHGYVSGRGITSFIYSKEGGQVASLTVNL
jgi:hypothetical protein